MKKIQTIFLISAFLVPTFNSVVFADRLETIGFENQSLTAGEEGTSAGCGGGWCFINTTATSSAVHSGSASYYSHPTTAANSWIGNQFRGDGTTSRVNIEVHFYYEVNTATNPIEIIGLWDAVAANRRAAIVLTSGGVGQLLTDDNSQVGSNSAALSANTWYCAQLGATGVGANSHLEGTITAGNCPDSPTPFATSDVTTIADFNAVYVGTPNATAVFGAYWDDIAVNDTATTNGSTQNSWPTGDNMVYLVPTASGDSAANTGTFADIDEIDPNDATDFINLDDATSIACFNITDTTGLIDSYDTINLVDVGVRLREESSAATSYQFSWKTQANGLTASSTTQDAGDTTWRNNQVGTTAMTNRMATTTDPQTLGAITTTLVNNSQLCVSSLTANNIDITKLWLVVHWTDGIAPLTSSPISPSMQLQGKATFSGKNI